MPMPSVLCLCGILLGGAGFLWKENIVNGPYEHGFDGWVSSLVAILTLIN